MTKIRIAMLITDLEPGGAERCLVELATGISRSRFEPRIYCLAPPPEPHRSLVPRLEAAGMDVCFLSGRRTWHFPQVVRRLVRQFRADQPDLVQSMLFHANIVGRMAARRAGIDRVVSGIRVAERRSRWHLWLDNRTQAAVDRYVCVSEAVARFSHDQGRLPLDKLLVIPNGIDLPRFEGQQPAEPEQLGVAAGARVATFVGRIARQKGVDWLVEQLPLWLSEQDRTEVLFVGEGPLRKRLQGRCVALGVAERVHWLGWRADVAAILKASDLLLLPSRWEGMPNAVLEAMAAGLPVLASDCEGVGELLGPGAAMQTAPFGEARPWAQRAARLLGDRQLNEQLGVENRMRVQKHFSLRTMIESYEALWEALVARRE